VTSRNGTWSVRVPVGKGLIELSLNQAQMGGGAGGTKKGYKKVNDISEKHKKKKGEEEEEIKSTPLTLPCEKCNEGRRESPYEKPELYPQHLTEGRQSRSVKMRTIDKPRRL